ncbi:MAG: hypothetical protein M3Y89_16820 [Actinomycetota bacterium]|nr:hypothetical protein [Actinomycetota bacterium]
MKISRIKPSSDAAGRTAQRLDPTTHLGVAAQQPSDQAHSARLPTGEDIYADLFDDGLDAVGAAWTRCDEILLWPR